MRNFKYLKRKNKSHIPFRLNLLFFIVFLLFSTIIVRLGYLQIIRGEEFEAIVKRTETTAVSQTVPRGLIYDRNGNILVGNQAQHSITYTRGTNDSVETMANTAITLSSMIKVNTSGLTERDLKDYWAATHLEALRERLSEEEKLLPGSELYTIELEKITPEDIDLTEAEKQAAAIFKSMNGATALTTINLKNTDVSESELAIVSENLSKLPGVDVSKDWARIYPYGDLLSTILGGVTSEQSGLPSGEITSYLAKGYARNDRVGNAYLEQQYETVLRGTKAQYEMTTNQNGETVAISQTYEGKKGDNLILTIDIPYQQKIEKIASDFLTSKEDEWNDRIYIVALNPKNGDVLGMTGKKIDVNTGEIVDSVHGVLNENFIMGSTVKGATVLAGYMDGVITLTDNTLIDEPMTFQGSKEKSSLFNQVTNNQIPVNDITALEKSSNIYMVKIAMMMGGQHSYEYNGPIMIDKEETLAILRSYYSQFGLGVKTGIDLPSESQGYLGVPPDGGVVLDEAYGQFDNYTPMQLAQYIATIASSGTRYAPRLVKEIRGTDKNGSLGAVESVMEPKIMNQLNVSQEAIKRVQQGMWQVTHSPTAFSTSVFGVNDRIGIAGKTGTGESVYQGGVPELENQVTTNSAFVGYAPFDDPEIAVAVIIPYLKENNAPATRITKQVIDAYFEKK